MLYRRAAHASIATAIPTLIGAIVTSITEHHLAGTPKPTPTRSDYRRLVTSF
jgi:hypothetical protein